MKSSFILFVMGWIFLLGYYFGPTFEVKHIPVALAVLLFGISIAIFEDR